jgi:hypothetical protein
MSLEQDVTAARAAVDELERAVARLTGHYRDSVDSRRLKMDVARLRDDINLLSGTGPAATQDPQFASVAWDDGYDSTP